MKQERERTDPADFFVQPSSPEHDDYAQDTIDTLRERVAHLTWRGNIFFLIGFALGLGAGVLCGMVITV